MRLLTITSKPLGTALITALLLAACGGSGPQLEPKISSATPSVTPPVTPADPSGTGAAPTPMSCIDGPSYQCSGDSSIRTDNGVLLTSSGVQAYGKSTNDLANPIVDKGTASGLTLASGGIAEIRRSTLDR